MLKFILLIAVIAAAAYFTKPSESEMHAAAEAKLHEVTSAAASNVDLGGTLGGLAAQAAGGKYEDFYVVARYSSPDAEHPLVQCWGVFKQNLCSKTGSPQ